jgi:hypothetical protein
MGGTPVETLQLFAPACTMEFYGSHLKTALGANKVRRLVHYYLDKNTELDDHVGYIYGKSLLYLVSRSYQSKNGIVPIMGMEKYWNKEAHPQRVTSYNTRDNPDRTRSESHGAFDNDTTTMNNALQILLGHKPNPEFTEDDLSGF